jgi:hypothetical protein
MTKIAIVGNIQVQEELPKLNWLMATEGELSLLLAKQRLWLYNQTRPEKGAIWSKGMNILDNTLYQKNKIGLHGATPYFNLPSELDFLGKAIKLAKDKTAPANGHYVNLDNRKGIEYGLDIDKVGYLTVEEYEKFRPECVYIYTFQDEYGDWRDEKRMREDCLKDWQLMVGFNEKMPKTAHHSIYQFMTDVNNRQKWTTTAQIKAERHSTFIGTVKKVTNLSFENLRLWYKNSIMHRNALNGLGDLTPEQNITQLVNNPNWDTLENWDKQHDGINEPFTIILIIIVSAKAIAGIIQVCKDKEPTAFEGLTDIALSPNFAASGKDHAKDKDDPKDPKDPKEDDPKEDDPKPENGVMSWIKANPAPSALIGAGSAYILYNLFKNNE